MKPVAFLFDLDGVIIDTEKEYENLWRVLGQRYGIEDPDFALKIKGNHLLYITDTYFPHLSTAEKKQLLHDLQKMEADMTYKPIAGAMDFLREVREQEYPLALVTSSSQYKMNRVYAQLPLRDLFHAVVTSDDIKRGKPFPDAFLLAAEKLNRKPEQCIVFEDSLSGIEAARAANTTVIALSTTFPKDILLKHVSRVIPDFRGFCLQCIV